MQLLSGQSKNRIYVSCIKSGNNSSRTTEMSLTT
uniref:Uncharacterized protein n=1 Tax=Rhizophora mucronata TaxID=61149 RepID=A0A2P2NQ34_RHIMU